MNDFTNPIHAFRDQINQIKTEVKRVVETELLRDAVRFNLSRLKDVDPEQAAVYAAMLDQIGVV